MSESCDEFKFIMCNHKEEMIVDSEVLFKKQCHLVVKK